MNNVTLAKSYLEKAKVRLKVLHLLMQEEAYSDVIREAQEAVELALKGMLRHIGVEPPKQHDVGYLLLEYSHKLPAEIVPNLQAIVSISRWLRKEREFSFYGDVDFIPTLEYTRPDGERACRDLETVLKAAEKTVIG
ncbi:MAG: HEPN domain-containing protein [Bacillota bacterium]